MQVVSAQGDGWVRGYEAQTGKKLWEFDTNPKDSVWPRTRNELIATPVIYQDVVYIANGQDPEHGEGVGHMYAIDATKRGDITKTGLVWHFDKIRRSISTAAIADGLLYVSDFSGYLHCLDVKTGQEYWKHDLLAAVWASPFLIDGKVYLGDEDGDIVVMAHGKEKKQLAEMNMGSAVYGTIVPANGVLFINNRSQLFAIATTSRNQDSGIRIQGWARPRNQGWQESGFHTLRCCWSSWSAALHGQQPARQPAAAPADEWRQFRGTPRLTGNSSTTLPATLKVLWTYDVGDLIDSSAAIANGVVYVGGGNGDLIALDLASGKLRWKYDDRQPDWRVVARGRRPTRSTSAISAASCTRSASPTASRCGPTGPAPRSSRRRSSSTARSWSARTTAASTPSSRQRAS